MGVSIHSRTAEIRILVADDHEAFRRSLRLLLESQPGFSVVAEAASGKEAVEMARELKPDVAILDVRMRPVTGLEAVSSIVHDSPRTGVLMVSMHEDKRYVARSVEAGARGYLLKDSLEDLLPEAIRKICSGGFCFSPRIREQVDGLPT